MLKSVDNLKASPEDIVGAPVEVSIEKLMNVSVFTSSYLRGLLQVLHFFFLIFEKVPFVLFIQCLKS